MTAQIRDILMYDEQELLISEEPLESFLRNKRLPYKLVAPNTACSRGYFSKWTIKDSMLFLIEWKGYILNFQKVDIDYIFPDEKIIFANWYTGIIRIGLGDVVYYIHGGYESIYQGDRFLEFKQGILMNDSSKWRTKEEIEQIIQEQKDLDW